VAGVRGQNGGMGASREWGSLIVVGGEMEEEDLYQATHEAIRALGLGPAAMVVTPFFAKE
jgi:hypothetical protein